MSKTSNVPIGPVWKLGPAAYALAGPVHSPAAKVLCSREVEADFLLSSWRRQHALLAVLDKVVDADGQASVEVLSTLTADFQALDPKRLLEKWYGCRVHGLGKAFEKLGMQRTERRGIYPGLVEILAEGGRGAATVRHMTEVTFQKLERLIQLPDWLRIDDMCQLETEVGAQLATIGESMVARGLLTSHEDYRQIIRSGIFDYEPLAALTMRGLHFNFPPHPWDGGPTLRPIRSSGDLFEVADRFHNCLRNRMSNCFAGTTFYYEWSGPTPAIVELRNEGNLFWFMSAVEGIRNGSVPLTEMRTIAEAIPLPTLNKALWKRLDALEVRG